MGTSTSGYAVFWTGTSTVSGDSGFYWDNVNKRLGIGTTTPSFKLTVLGDLSVNTSSTLGTVISGTWNGTAIGDSYVSSASTWNAKITTSSLSESITGVDYNSTTGVFSLTSGYGIPLSASTSNWQSFFDSPSSRITAGANLSWSGNTLSSTAGGGSTTTIAGLQPSTDVFLFSTGTSGTDFNVATTSPGTVTFNIPSASASNRGLLASSDWTTFNDKQSQIWGLSGSSLFASSTSWNIGIGTSTPGYKLDVWGDLRVNTSSTLGTVISGTWNGAVIDFSSYTNAAASSGIVFSGDSIVNNGVVSLTGTSNQVTISSATGTVTLSLPQSIATSSSPTFASTTLSNFTAGSIPFFGTSGVLLQNNSNLYWDSANNRLGIGTTTPSATFSVIGSSTISNALNVDSGTLFVDAVNDRVGIGTASPVGMLEVAGDQAATGGAIVGRAAAAVNNGTVTASNDDKTKFLALMSGHSGDAVHRINMDTAGDLLFGKSVNFPGSGFVELMRITSGGNVGIGMTPPATGRLNVRSDTGTAGTLIAQFQDNGTTPMVEIFNSADGTAANSANAVVKIVKMLTTNRSINAAGTINASGADYAEYFFQETPGSMEKGDLTCLALNSSKVVKCKTGGTMIGAVSTNAGFVGNDLYDPVHPENTELIALMGQVPVKVSTESGVINIGDRIAISSLAGTGMKATSDGITIGIAMESFDGSTSTTTATVNGQEVKAGKILVFMNLGYSKLASSLTVQQLAAGSGNGLETGDLVKFSETGGVVKTAGSGDEPAAGTVISFDAASSSARIAFSGKAPVKASTESGPIKTGDYLTSSSQPGVAMKAVQPGRVIGTALENFDGLTGKILVFVNPHWSLGSLVDDGSGPMSQFTAAVKNVLKELGLLLENGIARLTEVIADKITAKEFATEKLCVGSVCVTESQFMAVFGGSGESQPAVTAASSSEEETASQEISPPETSPVASEPTTSISATSTPTENQPIESSSDSEPAAETSSITEETPVSEAPASE